MATSVLPSPVFISAMLPWCKKMPPISCTSKARRPKARLAPSRQFANASGRIASNVSPFATRALNSPVFSINCASLNASNSGSNALIFSISGRTDFTLRSLGVPKTLAANFPKPSIVTPSINLLRNFVLLDLLGAQSGHRYEHAHYSCVFDVRGR